MKASEVVWVIARPGYGESTGLPEEIWRSRSAARRRLKELNEPWAWTFTDRKYKGPKVRPFRLYRMPIRE